MEKFKISDIQEIFTTDVERFHSVTERNVTQLLNEAAVSPEAMDEALRQCHTLKGLAATVEAWGLSGLGADFERLLELASSWVQGEREKANEVFQFILDHMQDWYVMNQFTCMEMLPQAWDVYQSLRGIMDDRWPGYLPAPAGQTADAQYVRLTELELADAETAEASSVAPAELKVDLDVQGTLPVAATPVTPAGAPLPVRVLPPILRRREEARAEEQTQSPAAAAQSVAGTGAEPKSGDQPATPKPLAVVPPTLLRRDAPEAITNIESMAAAPTSEPVVPIAEAPVAQTSSAPTAATPPNEVSPTLANAEAPAAPADGISTPPLLRVAPPALKRRSKKAERTAQEATDIPVVPETTLEQLAPTAAEVTASAEAVAAEAVSAEAIFAALPETVEATASVAPVEQSVVPVADASVAGEFKPGKDAELLEMLSQEVAGYLTELTASLSALAGDLAAQEPWEKTRRLFHTIKGTAGTFGLDTVSAPAKAAEARCIVAVEDASARTRETYETCVQRAAAVAKSLQLRFDEGRLREALETALAQAANTAAASATVPVVASLDAEMAGFFINDTRDQIGIIEQAVLRWERVPAGKSELASEQLWAAQRGFHTIKGAGNSIGLTAVSQSVHEVEAFLEGLAGKGAAGSKAIFTFLLGAVDQLRQYLAGLATNTASPWRHDWSAALRMLCEPAEGEKVGAGSTINLQRSIINQPVSVENGAAEDAVGVDANSLRIETARLHQLMNLISEMVIDRARLARKIEQLAGLHRALAERNGALTGSVLNFQQQFEFNLMQQEQVRNAEGGARNAGGATQSVGGPAGSAHGEFSELEFDRYDQFNVLARSLVEISHDIEQLNGDVAACLDSFAAENVHFTQTSQELQSKVTSLGLVPVKTLFPRLQRAFRDALSVEGKEADLVLTGGESMLDKVVVDKVFAPLLHLLRNAVSHGIEDAATREKRKKSARGEVRLSAAQLSNQIVLQISDDGGGVDAAAVRERAVAKGWLAKDAPELSAEQVAGFIFRPGFTTAAKVTSVSGRGIGLDVVRKEIENLNGSVELKFVPGEGSTWSLRLPLTLSISEAILAEVGGTQYAFPLNFVEAGLILEPERLVKPAVDADGSPVGSALEQYPVERHVVAEAAEGEEEGPKFDLLPVLRLSQLFGLPSHGATTGNENSNKGLIASVGDRRAIVVVDVVLRRQEIVVKQLDAVMAQHPLLNGASLDAEGRVIPILNLPTLLKWGESSRLHAPSSKVPSSKSDDPKRGTKVERGADWAQRCRVLVVDDSLSVRKVQERFLRDLGCQVTVASDGLVALERLREQDFDLIFTDLEMPRLNGYELISEVRGNPAWSDVPMVVISSRGADKYITKAMNLGASTFLSKPFTQEQLLQVLGHYVRG